jgi:hypothetical protein
MGLDEGFDVFACFVAVETDDEELIFINMVNGFLLPV